MFNLNIMYHQRGRAADDAGFCQDVTIGGRSDMTSVDFNSDWNKLGQIDLPAGVETSCGFCENHTDPAMQQAQGLASPIGHWHSKQEPFCVGRNDFNTKSFWRRLREQGAQLFNGSNPGQS